MDRPVHPAVLRLSPHLASTVPASGGDRGRRWRREPGLWLAAAPAVVFLLVFYAIPLLILIVRGAGGEIPFAAVFGYLSQPFGQRVVINTLLYGLQVTVLCVVVGTATAIGAWLAPPWIRNLVLIAAVVPLTAATIVKTFGWMILLRTNGVAASVIEWLGIADAPVRMLFTVPALILGTANLLLPFVILPVYAVLSQIDRTLLGAAATLGASQASAIVRVVLPLAAPGIVAGTVLVFTQTIAAYAIPTLLIGDRYPVLSRQAVTAYLILFDDRRGAMLATIMVALAVLAIATPALLRSLFWRRR
jgi:putative spermidine/putrescine transport system permease protein